MKKKYAYINPEMLKWAREQTPFNSVEDVQLKLRDINLSAHSLRKTFAYRVWLENGKDIFFVKELLGHSTVEYTKRYLGLDIELYGRTLSSLNSLII